MAAIETRQAYEFYRSIDHLLDRAVVAAVSSETGRIGESRRIGEIEPGAILVVGRYPYERRCVVEPTRALIGQTTEQPAIGLEQDGAKVRPLVYAEDLVGLPFSLAVRVLGHLEALTTNRVVNS